MMSLQQQQQQNIQLQKALEKRKEIVREIQALYHTTALYTQADNDWSAESTTQFKTQPQNWNLYTEGRNFVQTQQQQQADHRTQSQQNSFCSNGSQQQIVATSNTASTTSSANNNLPTSFNGNIYQVQFKRCTRDFVPGPLAPTTLAIGDFVVAECERGEDLGVVTEIMSMKTFVDRRYMAKVTAVGPEDAEETTVGRITRLATAFERQQLPEKFHDEQTVLQLANHLARNMFKLPMQVLDAEYQFDRLKLTIYYSADVRIDFRELVRDLFSSVKTRIWMKKVTPSKPFVPKQFASMQLTTGAQFNASSASVHC